MAIFLGVALIPLKITNMLFISKKQIILAA